MQRVKKNDKVPDSSIILKDFGEVDYCDSYQIIMNTDNGLDNIITEIFKTPKWVNLLMKIRDSIVRIFGLKTGDVKDKNVASHYPIGSKAVLFTVVDRNDREVVMAEDDSHLNFRISVLMDRNETCTYVYLTTIVKFNTIWGRIYFLPVKPFHQIIIKSLLKRAIR